MRKTLLLAIGTIFLLTGVVSGQEIIREPTPIIRPLSTTERIEKRINDEFGWDKELVKRRIKEGVYTDTQIREFGERVVNEEVGKDISAFVKKMAIVKIDYVKIKKIALDILKFKAVSVDIFKLSVSEIDYMLIEYPRVKGIVIEYLTPEAIRTLFTKIDATDISKLVIFVIDIGYQARKLKTAMRIDATKIGYLHFFWKDFVVGGSASLVDGKVEVVPEIERKMIGEMKGGEK